MSVDLNRLTGAAQSLLDPLFDRSDDSGENGAFVMRLADELERCAATGESMGLRGMTYLSRWVSPFLRSRVAGAPTAADHEHAEHWIGELIAFCAGQLRGQACASLVTALAAWPRMPVIPDQFVTLISERLRRDAERIHQALKDGEGTIGVDSPQAASRPRRNGLDAGRAEEVEVVTLARDECELLARAAEQLGRDWVPALLAADDPTLAPSDERASSPRSWADLLADCGEQVEGIANAVGHLGLRALAQALRGAGEFVRAQAADSSPPESAAREDLRRLLIELPGALAAYFADPGVVSAADLVRLLRRVPLGPVETSEDPTAALERTLAAVRLVRTRQVLERDERVSEDDVSLAIPGDADRAIVDNLRRELPQLSAAFGNAIDGVRAGDVSQLVVAQRVAHTLKGSANTVGVRGVANLTHVLEDILQILARDRELPPADLADHLQEAADCLADMCEAVAGVGAAPGHAMTVYAQSLAWANRLVRADGADGDAGVSGLEPEAARRELARMDDDSEGFPGPIGELTASPAGIRPDAASEASAGVPGAAADTLRVPTAVVDRLLELAGEAVITLAHFQERLLQLDDTRATMRMESERLQDLSAELDRLVDVRGLALTGRSRDSGFDPLELDEYNDLHTVSRRIAEAGADTRVIDQQFEHDLSALRDQASRLERLQGDLREATLRTRMQDVAAISPRLQRAIRQASRMAGKRVELAIEGADTAIDGQLLAALVDPLTHLLRNAVDHAIEFEAERMRHGKPPQGRVRLAFRREGATLTIRCADDGRGLDLRAIRQRAHSLGILGEGDPVGERELARVILLPGFTTRIQSTQLSGRGVGLDVVSQAIRELGGRIDIESDAGRGASFTLTVPLRMAAVPVMVARTASHVLAISVRDLRSIVAADQRVLEPDGREQLVLDGQRIDVVALETLLGLPAGALLPPGDISARQVALVVDGDAGRPIAVLAPEVGQTRQVILQPLPTWLPPIPGVAGVAVLGDGAVAPILDLARMLREQRDAPVHPVRGLERPDRHGPLCLVVDDSVSVRRAMEQFLRDIGMQVDVAADGLEGLACVRRRRPDLAILDLEMPRMNGIELARALRADARTADMPIIMITSRYSDRHKRVALAAGVDVFVTKPYTEDELAAQVQRCLYRSSG